jgi:hypothetical protein
MKSKPVRKYADPKYPTRLQAAARPGLLQRHQPPAWRKWPELTGAAGLFLLADTARLAAADGAPKRPQTPAQTNAVAIVAPVFHHGEGRGATGCIVMAPPVFLSEEEALQVIREEMAAHGVKLGTNDTAVAGVMLERVVWSTVPPGSTNQAEPAHRTYEVRNETFKADAADPKKKVFIEFLGERDAWDWESERRKEENDWFVSTVHAYDMPKTAEYVAGRVKRQAINKVYFGAFYDPLDNTWRSRKAPAQGSSGAAGQGKVERPADGWASAPIVPPDRTAESRRLLRLQVRDFLKWLQAQGAL